MRSETSTLGVRTKEKDLGSDKLQFIGLNKQEYLSFLVKLLIIVGFSLTLWFLYEI